MTRKMTDAAPASPEPNSARGTSMKLAPRKAATAPTADAIEFIVTTCSRGTTWGSAADSPDMTNRASPLTTNAPHSTNRSRAPSARQMPTTATDTTRPTLAAINTSRRSQRSISAPANGPSSEYGRNSTANAPAMASALEARSGLNSSAPARPAWKSPSPNWLASRSSSSRQKSGSARTERQTATGALG